jgi:hypothetical protein
MRRTLALAVALVGSAVLPAMAASPTQPRWTVPIDSRSAGQWLSEAAGSVYGPIDGRLAAIAVASGRIRWQSDVRPDSRSVVHGAAVLAPESSGLAFLDVRSGRVFRRIALGGTPAVAVGTSGFVSVVAARSGIDVRGWSEAGRPTWQRTLTKERNERLIQLGGDAVGLIAHDRVLVLDAKTGNAVAATDGIDELIGADGRYLWFNVVGGGIKGLDLDSGRTLAIHSSIVRGSARVEHGIAVAVVDGRLTRLDLRSGVVARLPIYGRWIGGPIAGRRLIARGDGAYVQTLSGAGGQRRVAPYRGDLDSITSDGHDAIIGHADGTIDVIDVVAQRRLATFATSCRDYEGFAQTQATTLVHCDADAQRSELLAFARP